MGGEERGSAYSRSGGAYFKFQPIGWDAYLKGALIRGGGGGTKLKDYGGINLY